MRDDRIEMETGQGELNLVKQSTAVQKYFKQRRSMYSCQEMKNRPKNQVMI